MKVDVKCGVDFEVRWKCPQHCRTWTCCKIPCTVGDVPIGDVSSTS